MTSYQKTMTGQAAEESFVDGGKVMSLFDHLHELRNRIFKCLVAVVLLFFVALFFSSEILIFLKEPLLKALPEGDLHFTGPLDVFLIGIKVSFLCAIVFSCPYWLFQFWKFVEPALYPRERKYIMPFAAFSAIMFFTGVAFCHFLIIPLTLKFLIGLGVEVGTPIITITDYISMLTLMLFGFGFVFEAPLILVLLAFLEVLDAKMLANARRYVAVGVLVVGALLTPPDPVSQVAMAIPLYLMYELSIIIIRAIEKNRVRE